MYNNNSSISVSVDKNTVLKTLFDSPDEDKYPICRDH